MTDINNNIRRAFFYLDYLRMHNYGRKHMIFKKNRYMIDHTTAEDSRRGYKAYIGRIFKDIVASEVDFVEVKKPRRSFGYNIGSSSDFAVPNNIEGRYIEVFESKWNKIRYAFRRYLLYREFQESMSVIKDLFQRNHSTLDYNFQGLNFRVMLSDLKSNGWKAFQVVKLIVAEFNKIEKEITPEKCIKNTMVNLLPKIMKPMSGMQFYMISSTGLVNENIIYTILTVEPQRQNGETVGYTIRYRNPGGQTGRVASHRMKIIHNAETIQETPEMKITKEICERAAQLLKESQGIEESGAFRLAVFEIAQRNAGTSNADIARNLEYTNEIQEYIYGLTRRREN